ncbi:MAG: hypothetical protein ACPG4L_07740, partial [Candidatus Puniceispirillaceae bacterium]
VGIFTPAIRATGLSFTMLTAYTAFHIFLPALNGALPKVPHYMILPAKVKRRYSGKPQSVY